MTDDGLLALALTGDSMITRRVSRSRDEQARRLFDRIQGADVAFTNLEVLPTDFRGHPAQESGGDHMAAHAWVIDDLLEMGFDMCAASRVSRTVPRQPRFSSGSSAYRGRSAPGSRSRMIQQR